MSETALKQLTNLFHDTHARLSRMAARSINTSLVVRNRLYGWYIVEFEQGADSRQQLYGKALIDQLAKSLATRGIKGISPTNLRKFRQFYLAFPATDAIQQTLSVESLKGENWWRKYAVTAKTIEAEHDAASKQWQSFLLEFGYE